MATRGVNKVILIGNLGSDPEVRYMPSGGAVANVSVATTDTWKDKKTGQNQDKTEWHRVVMFNRLGEIAGEYLRKGSKVYIEGSLRTNKWQDQQGNDRYTTEIVASNMQMLDSRSDIPSSGNFQPAQNASGGNPNVPPIGNGGSMGGGISNYSSTNPTAAGAENQAVLAETFEEDDIPF